MADWYYVSNGQQAGPVDDEQLRNLISGGQVGPADLVWRDGMPNWQPASSITELSAGRSGPVPVAPYSGSGQQPYAAQPGQPLAYGGYPQQSQYPPGSVPNYLVQSILVTILCCMPLGIPAIVFAAQVNSKLAAGDYAGAVDASNKAKMFSWISFGIGVVVVLFYVVMGAVGGLAHH
ncbi:MAG TPA: CD225/dispanin family protein [Tepidisphaeraceae bacterium]|nr:CD225/dispanin family protein [Tepidisphaeraceae bacterium]